jgi:hypothetical protein
MRMTPRFFALSAVALAALPAFAQEKVPTGTVLFQTNVGSFKILPRGKTPAQGTLNISFTGTLLISGMRAGGTVTPTGNLRREYNNTSKLKQVWFGTGNLVIRGTFAAIQWFGRDMKAQFDGFATMRLFGEFDKNLNTGFWWYPGDKTKNYWFANGATPVDVPKSQRILMDAPPKPRSKGD